MKDVVLIRGDGIGPEIMETTLQALYELGVAKWINFHEFPAGEAALSQGLEPLPAETLRAVDRFGNVLKGPLGTPIASGYQSINVALRQRFGLYANVRPVKGTGKAGEPIDLVIIRENLEDLYSGFEFPVSHNEEIVALAQKELGKKIRKDSAIALKVIGRHESRRIARFAFEWARDNGRRKVTAVHKANILKETDGLFLAEVRKTAKKFPEIEYGELIVDNAAQQLVLNPTKLDVMLCPNLYGDILSDLAAALVGGIGLAPSAQFGSRVAMFEAVHGTAPDIAGQGIANPAALMLSAALMLKHLGDADSSARLSNAVFATLERVENLPTTAFGDIVVRELRKARRLI